MRVGGEVRSVDIRGAHRLPRGTAGWITQAGWLVGTGASDIQGRVIELMARALPLWSGLEQPYWIMC